MKKKNTVIKKPKQIYKISSPAFEIKKKKN